MRKEIILQKLFMQIFLSERASNGIIFEQVLNRISLSVVWVRTRLLRVMMSGNFIAPLFS